MTREEFYKLTDILSTDVLGNFMRGGEADELIAMFEEVVEHSNILEQEESVSEDLEDAAYKFVMDNFGNPKEPLYKFDQRCFRAGAKWQEEKDNEEKVFTYKHGFNDCKEQMMAKAVDGVVAIDYYGDDDKTYGCIAHDSFCLEDFGLKDTDKVKMILIKED